MAHPEFVDDRLDKDMVEIRKIMKCDGTNPRFKIEFQRTNENDIVMQIYAETNDAPRAVYHCPTIEQIGEGLIDYIKLTSRYVH